MATAEEVVAVTSGGAAASGETSMDELSKEGHWGDVIFGIAEHSLEVTARGAELKEEHSVDATQEDVSVKGKHSGDVTVTGIALKEERSAHKVSDGLV